MHSQVTCKWLHSGCLLATSFWVTTITGTHTCHVTLWLCNKQAFSLQANCFFLSSNSWILVSIKIMTNSVKKVWKNDVRKLSWTDGPLLVPLCHNVSTNFHVTAINPPRLLPEYLTNGSCALITTRCSQKWTSCHFWILCHGDASPYRC